MKCSVPRRRTAGASARMMKARADDFLLLAIFDDAVDRSRALVERQVRGCFDVALSRAVFLCADCWHVFFILWRKPRELLGLLDGRTQRVRTQIIRGS